MGFQCPIRTICLPEYPAYDLKERNTEMHCGVMVTGYNQGDWDRLMQGDYDRPPTV